MLDLNMSVCRIILILLAAPACLKSQFREGLFTWAPGEQTSQEFNIPRTQNTTVESSNNTVERTSVYSSDVLKEVIQIACPMDCSSHGKCIQGQCYCEGTFGDVDCSVDLSLPPVIYGIPNRGICDLRRKYCDHVSILGDNFVGSEGLSCRLSVFEVKLNGTRFHENNYVIVKGVKISSAEISCPIPYIKSELSVQLDDELDTVAVGYMIAVGYNKNNFSRDISLLLFDSECVSCTKAGFDIECEKREEFKVENLRCVRKSIPSTPNEIGWIIGVAVGSAVVLLTGFLLLGYLMQKKKRKKMKKVKIEKACQELREMERKTEYDGIVEEVYDQIVDLPDTYSTIPDSSMTPNESTKNEESYVKLNTATNAENEGYSSLINVVQDERNSDHENPTSKGTILQSETGNSYSRK